VTGKRGRKRKQLDDLGDTRGYWKLKEEALDRTVWRTGFGRGCGPVVTHTVHDEGICNTFWLMLIHYKDKNVRDCL